jgi:hypothetical protein
MTTDPRGPKGQVVFVLAGKILNIEDKMPEGIKPASIAPQPG